MNGFIEEFKTWSWLDAVFQTVLKEGNLMKQTNSFQRWKRRYFKLRGRTLYYAQTSKVTDVDMTPVIYLNTWEVPLWHHCVGAVHSATSLSMERCSVLSCSVSLQSIIFDEVDLTDASVAESSTKNVNNSFTVSRSSSSSFSCRLFDTVSCCLKVIRRFLTAVNPATRRLTPLPSPVFFCVTFNITNDSENREQSKAALFTSVSLSMAQHQRWCTAWMHTDARVLAQQRTELEHTISALEEGWK